MVATRRVVGTGHPHGGQRHVPGVGHPDPRRDLVVQQAVGAQGVDRVEHRQDVELGPRRGRGIGDRHGGPRRRTVTRDGVSHGQLVPPGRDVVGRRHGKSDRVGASGRQRGHGDGARRPAVLCLQGNLPGGQGASGLVGDRHRQLRRLARGQLALGLHGHRRADSVEPVEVEAGEGQVPVALPLEEQAVLAAETVVGGPVAERGERGVRRGAVFDHLAHGPGLTVVARQLHREVAPDARVLGVAEQQPPGARVVGFGVGEGADDRPVVGGIDEFGVRLERRVGLAAILGDRDEPMRRRAAVEQHPAVGEFDGFVLVGSGADQLTRPPRLAVVVAVDAEGVVLSVEPDRVLLDQPTGVGAPAQLDAFAGGREHAAPGGVLHHVGDPAMPPGPAIVVAVAVVEVQDVGVRRVVAGLGVAEAPIDRGGVEDEDPAGLAVHEQAGVPVAVGSGVPANHLLGSPGLAAVGAAAHEQGDVGGQVGHRGSAVVHRQQVAVGQRGERGDAVTRMASLVAGCEVGHREPAGRGPRRHGGRGRLPGGGARRGGHSRCREARGQSGHGDQREDRTSHQRPLMIDCDRFHSGTISNQRDPTSDECQGMV
ncbi:hypothetical protein SacglDRAFT_01539 [Saccharomonospora glauca K62]|uniref:Uncharacterized protein n=1 Tax=Saccharomonospora glauca K62 TaxID=928724 RepID=I1D0I5_9PSEU|nr:hypothetical protein SacglDRAFT_01539 [Saccharomonospora glauca K62]